MKWKYACSLDEKLWQTRKHIKKQRHYFADKGLSSQSWSFSSSHIWMWELDHKESWVPKNWCFWTVVLEKTLLESPSDCKEIKPVNPEGNQSWIFIGRTDAEAPILCHLMWRTDSLEKTLMLGKIEGRRRRGQQMVGSHHLTQWTWVWASSVGDGLGSLVCCSPWSWTRLSDLTELTEKSSKINILWVSVPENVRPSGWTELRKEFCIWEDRKACVTAAEEVGASWGGQVWERTL